LNSGNQSRRELDEILKSFCVFAIGIDFCNQGCRQDKYSSGENGSFVTLKQGDGREFRAFVAGPADAKAAILIVDA